MSEWPMVELSKVADVSSGDGAPQEASAFAESGTPFIRAGSLALLLDGVLENQLELIPDCESSRRRMRKYPPRTVVFAKSGMSSTKGLVYELKGPAHVVNHLAALQCGSDLSPRFLLRWFQLHSPARLIANPSYPSIRISDIRSEKIPLPPLAEQKRIAAILDAADALRVKRRESLEQLDSLLQSTFLDMFGDPMTNPMGWEVQPLKELLGEKSINGAYYPKDAYSDCGTLMVHMADAFYGVVNPGRVKRVNAPVADIEKYDLRPTDLLVSRRSLNYEGSAKPCLIPETDEPLIFESSLIRVRPNPNRVLTIYLFHYLQNDRARASYVFPLVTRSTISGINQSNLMKVKILLPPLDLQRSFAAVVESVELQKTRLRCHLAELDSLFSSLQSRAFRGEL